MKIYKLAASTTSFITRATNRYAEATGITALLFNFYFCCCRCHRYFAWERERTGQRAKRVQCHHLCKSSTKQRRNADSDGDSSHHDGNMVERRRCCSVGDQALSFYRRMLRLQCPNECPVGTSSAMPSVAVLVPSLNLNVQPGSITVTY